MTYRYLFTMVRDSESGELELDTFARIDLDTLRRAQGAFALCGEDRTLFQSSHPDLHSAMQSAHRARLGIEIRSKVQGNTLFNTTLKMVCEDLFEREDMENIVRDMPVKELRRFL